LYFYITEKAAKYFFVPLLLVLFSFRQEKPAHLVIKAKFDYFTVDNIGNMYLVNEDELLKYLPSGKFFARYSNLKLGRITSVDATNPLKILLYYRDFQQIVYIDDQLTANAESISLEELGYEQTDLVCAGANNSFWIYNKQNNELIRFDELSKRVAATGNLKQILRTEISPNYMIERNNFLYLNSPETGVYVFDIFGTFSKVISLKNLKAYQVYDDIIYYQKDSSFCSYNFKYFEEACKALPGGAKATSSEYNKGKVYTAFKDSLVVGGI
jgi:hypothetical protein